MTSHRALEVTRKAASCSAQPAAGVVEPGPELGHRGRAQRVDPYPGVEVGVRLGDQPALAQHPQVLAHHRRRDAELAGQLAGPARPFGEQLDGAPPDRVGQRGERVVERRGRGFAHCPVGRR